MPAGKHQTQIYRQSYRKSPHAVEIISERVCVCVCVLCVCTRMLGREGRASIRCPLIFDSKTGIKKNCISYLSCSIKHCGKTTFFKKCNSPNKMGAIICY